MKQIILFGSLFLVLSYTQGQNLNNQVTFDFYMGAGLSKLDDRIVDTYSLIEPTYRIGALIGGGVYFGCFGVNLEIGGFSINDNDSFMQLNTSGNYESTTFGWHATPSIGGKYKVKKFDFILNVGYALASAQRSITDCIDCRTEKVSINNGATIRPKVVYHLPKKYFFTSYEHYSSNHMQSLILVGFGYRTNR
ncbi:hypothetical protein N9I47_00565 [bacterium]|jgi:hypothetical protein|nr:hypothetical protein [bacterium]